MFANVWHQPNKTGRGSSDKTSQKKKYVTLQIEMCILKMNLLAKFLLDLLTLPLLKRRVVWGLKLSSFFFWSGLWLFFFPLDLM